jgi:hypothetical protein
MTTLSRLSLLAASAALLLGAQAASAATIGFGSQGSVSSGVYSFTGSGVTVTGTGYENLISSTITYASPATVVQSSGGLGVNSSIDATNNEVDSGANPQGSVNYYGEGILFQFSTNVTITSIIFGSFDSDDGFDFAFASGNAPTGDFLLQEVALGTGATVTWTPVGGYTGTHFLISAVEDSGTTARDNFYIKGVTFDVAAADVPVPGVLGLLGAGLLGLGLAARRRAA